MGKPLGNLFASEEQSRHRQLPVLRTPACFGSGSRTGALSKQVICLSGLMPDWSQASLAAFDLLVGKDLLPSWVYLLPFTGVSIPTNHFTLKHRSVKTLHKATF